MRLSFFILFLFIYQFFNSQSIISGAERMDAYIGKLKGKKVAIVCNHSSRVGSTHLVDSLISRGIKIVKIFAPEHGFRGNADAGAHVKSGIDIKTGIPIQSLYGENKKPKKEDMKDVQSVVFDIQDVGCRFYTYISTLQYMMEACADLSLPFIILDRPNPNGHYVDGPVLDMKYKSFVGMQPVPIVYGMTVGEYSKMLFGEKWLNTKKTLNFLVIECKNYDHNSKVNLTIPPSPNLVSNQAILLYSSLCLFEGTDISVGRGTETPFEVFGSPYLDKSTLKYEFKPQAKKGATNPPFLNQTCNGMNLNSIFVTKKFDLTYLMTAYKYWTKDKSEFFLKNLFFDKLAGNNTLRQQIIDGKSEEDIRITWEPALHNFKKIRKKYLIYKDFQ